MNHQDSSDRCGFSGIRSERQATASRHNQHSAHDMDEPILLHIPISPSLIPLGHVVASSVQTPASLVLAPTPQATRVNELVSCLSSVTNTPTSGRVRRVNCCSSGLASLTTVPTVLLVRASSSVAVPSAVTLC